VALNSLLCADVPLKNYSLTHASDPWSVTIRSERGQRRRCGTGGDDNIGPQRSAE